MEFVPVQWRSIMPGIAATPTATTATAIAATAAAATPAAATAPAPQTAATAAFKSDLHQYVHLRQSRHLR